MQPLAEIWISIQAVFTFSTGNCRIDCHPPAVKFRSGILYNSAELMSQDQRPGKLRISNAGFAKPVQI
jgi:hypothetical protein